MKRGSSKSAVRKAGLMRGKGITYDINFLSAGVSTHEPFDLEMVKRDMLVIHDDSHCNSDPREDLDMASYGVVKVLEDRLGHSSSDIAWEPKAAFTALADYYRG